MAFETRELADGAILLLGGRSEIGLQVVRRIAAGRMVVLAARNSDDLGTECTLVADAGARGVACVEFDADDLEAHERVIAAITADYGPIGVAVLAFGVLGDQERAQRDATYAASVVHTDYVAQVSVLTILARELAGQPLGTTMRHGPISNRGRGRAAPPLPRGQVVVFSSVAGVRVRRANYVYGSAKAGLDGFASGLSDALHRCGVHLLLVRPGFVIGRMTAGMTPAPMSSTPGQVADAVVSGLYRRKSRVWVPSVLRPVFGVARLVPQALWRRLPR